MSILKLTDETLSSPAVAGQIEYDSPILAATPISTERGVIVTPQFYRLNAGLAGANVNTAQNVLGVGVTLSSSTVYAFEGVYTLVKTAGTTAHTIGLGFGGTATVNNVQYHIAGITDNSSTVAPFIFSTNATGIVMGTAVSVSNTTVSYSITSAAARNAVRISGVISVNAGGTFIPQYTLSAAPGGAYTTQAGSYFLIYPIGDAGAATNIGTWA